MGAHTACRSVLPDSVPASIRDIADPRAVFRYRVGWRNFFLSSARLPKDHELTAWVALHDTGHAMIAGPDNGGVTVALSDIPSHAATSLVANAFGGTATRRLVKATLLASGLDDALAYRLAPRTNFRQRQESRGEMHTDLLDGCIGEKPRAIATDISVHRLLAIARRPETVFLDLRD